VEEQMNFTSENFTSEELETFTPEQRFEIAAIEKAVNDFLADRRTIRYVQTEANKEALYTFLESRNLKLTLQNLLFAYDSLRVDGALELLLPISPVLPVSPSQPDPEPSAERFAPRSRGGAFAAFRNGQPLHVHGPRNLQ
jgi:hypothetical protein